jgi:type IX secretion system PorP/SprF family membrane protein
MFIPDANFGVSYTRDEFYLGFSMTNMLRSAIKFSSEQDNKYKELGHFFLTGGYHIALPSDDWQIEPSVLIKSSDAVFKSLQVDINTLVYYKDTYWGGLSYRTNDALVFIAGLRYDQFYFSYAFDFTLTDIRNHSFGTHEFSFAVKFGDNARRYRWLNRY